MNRDRLKKRRRSVGAVFLIALSVFLLTRRLAAIGAGAKPAGDGEWAKSVVAAKKEGKLAVFLYQGLRKAVS